MWHTLISFRRRRKPTPIWNHEHCPDSICCSDWNLSGVAGQPGSADSCWQRCSLLSGFIHTGNRMHLSFSKIVYKSHSVLHKTACGRIHVKMKVNTYDIIGFREYFQFVSLVYRYFKIHKCFDDT